MRIAVFLHACCLTTTIYGSEFEYRLIQDLRNDYDPVERPVENHTDAVHVQVRILLQQLIDIDERNQAISMVIWTQMSWHDYKMTWNPREYGNITVVNLPPGSLWKPDILLFNTADEHFDASFPVNMAVRNNGEVLVAPPSIVKVSCSFDLTFFPFDDQICFLKFGSWTYTGSQVDLSIDNSGLTEENQMDLLYYVPNATPAERVANDFHGERYVELYFRMHLKRRCQLTNIWRPLRTLYYGLNWIVPSVLISLSNVLGFTLPTECGEKLTLQITNLLAVLVFLGMVSEVIPPSSESIPVIVAFFSASLLLMGLSAICTVLVINVHYRNPKTHKLTKPMRAVFLDWLPWLLLMNRPGKRFSKKIRRPRKRRYPEGSFLSGEFSMPKSQLLDSADEYDWREMPRRDLATRRVSAPQPLTLEAKPCQAELQEIIILLYAFKERVEDDAFERDCAADYKYIAMVLDRLFLFVFSAAYLSAVLAFVSAAPRVLTNK